MGDHKAELAVFEAFLNPLVISIGMLKMQGSFFLFSLSFENPLTLLGGYTGKEGINSAKNTSISFLRVATVPLQLLDLATKLETALVIG